MRLFGVHKHDEFSIDIMGRALGADLLDILKAKLGLRGSTINCRVIALKTNSGYVNSSKLAMKADGEEIVYTQRIYELFSSIPEKQVHFRFETSDVELLEREKHYANLNRVLKKQRREASETTTYSSITWNDVSEIYEKMIVYYDQPLEQIPEEELEDIKRNIRKRVRRIGRPSNKNKRVKSAFIESVILRVIDLFPEEDDIHYDMEVPLSCPEINCSGFADFVISRGDRKILIVEAKRDDVSKGLAQSLLMMDTAMAINEAKGISTQSICGLVSDFKSWTFLKRTDGVIHQDEDVVGLQHHLDEDIARVAGKLYHILRHG